MDEQLKRDIAKYLYPFLGNTCYQNKNYLDSLIKKYDKKTVLEALQEESLKGKITDAFKK
jgi:hypothetical protein